MLKTDFDDTLKEIGLSRQNFANITNITYGAVSNWNDKSKPIPGWVESWLTLYIENEKFKKLKQVLKESGAYEQ